MVPQELVRASSVVGTGHEIATCPVLHLPCNEPLPFAIDTNH